MSKTTTQKFIFFELCLGRNPKSAEKSPGYLLLRQRGSILLKLSGGLCKDYLVLICHILIFFEFVT